jgi:hypothetical protein
MTGLVHRLEQYYTLEKLRDHSEVLSDLVKKRAGIITTGRNNPRVADAVCGIE